MTIDEEIKIKKKSLRLGFKIFDIDAKIEDYRAKGKNIPAKLEDELIKAQKKDEDYINNFYDAEYFIELQKKYIKEIKEIISSGMFKNINKLKKEVKILNEKINKYYDSSKMIENNKSKEETK